MQNSNNLYEKNKPFRLVKYFTFISLIMMFIGTITISMINTHWIKNMLLKKSEDYALLLVNNLNHQIFIQFVIPVAVKYGKIQLRNKKQFKRMDKVARSTLHSFEIHNLNIYDLKNTVAYSFDNNIIGLENTGGGNYHRALEGETISTLVQDGGFWEMLLGIPKESKLVTFAPIRAEKPLSIIYGQILGVVEIIQDISEDYKAIFKLQILVIATCSIVMMILFLILLFVVKSGEEIIQKRAQERLHLKEQLARTEHLSNIGKMTAGISHEIRNPLGIIMNSAEHLQKKANKTGEQVNPILNIIIEESSRLNNIVTDFLNFAKPTKPKLLQCRIEDILMKNITALKSQFNKQGYIIQKNFQNDLPFIMVDTEMIYQAFLNIFINAMQAMPVGGIIHLKVVYIDDFIEIVFQDTGSGISDNAITNIWDPFFTTKEEGTGLGLGIVKNIIESHNGTIEIKNLDTGHGVQVGITLPVTSHRS